MNPSKKLCLLIFVLLAGAAAPAQDPAESAWRMHPVDDRFRGANGLAAADVNGDGLLDFLTNYEFDQRLVIALNPGPDKALLLWPGVVAWKPEPLKNGRGVNPESSTLGDFDGDGNIDLASAQGFSKMPFWEGSEPGVRIVWGPARDRVTDSTAWIDAGRIPETIDRGHLIYLLPFDVNNDGALDIVSGGRIHAGNKRKGGVIWLEAPRDPASRRDLAKWRVHDIDPDQFSAHGLVLEDVDLDGDRDIVLANADFDTPESEEKILCYENPGAGSELQKSTWPQHVIYQGSEFYVKPQVAIADLDQDGLSDLVTQTEKDLYWFRKTGVKPVSFERIVIPKDPAAQWLGRPVRVADLNNDGRLDIIGGLIHKGGDLPGDKASVFWMEYKGAKPKSDNWQTHVVKFGSGKTMQLPIFGEKWDLMTITDVDQDGDLDIVANCEEWWEADIEFRFFWDPAVNANSVAVVWFENRMNEPEALCREKGGRCEFEAERYSSLGDGTWIIRAREPGFSGDGYLQDHRQLKPDNIKWEQSPGAEYALELKGGEYFVWVRALAPKKWGRLGRSESNSAWVGIDRENFRQLTFKRYGEWRWTMIAGPVALAPGRHLLNLRIREGGFAIDRIILTTDRNFQP